MNQMTKRLAMRTLAFFVLTCLCFIFMRPLTIESGHADVLKCMTAAAVLFWAEIVVMWVRIAQAPRLDEQKAAEQALNNHDTRAAAAIYAVYAYKWTIRLGAFIWLYQGVL